MNAGRLARSAIFTCDEFGESHSANVAVIEAMEQGLGERYPVGATLQMPAPWAPEAARYAATHPDADVGVHLTIECRYRTMGFRPVCGRTEAPGLCAPDGYMWETSAGAWEHSSEDEIHRECKAQIEAALSFGVDVSHLDGHGGLQGADLAGYARVCGALAKEYRLPLRMQPRRRYEAQGAAGAWEAVRALGILTCDDDTNLGLRQGGESYTDFYLRRLAGLSPGLTDLYVHPCVDSAELRALQPARADERIEQYNLLVHDAAFTEALSRSGVRVITWRSVRERQRGRPAAE